MEKNKQLTKAEFQVMDILWNLPGQSGFTGDIRGFTGDILKGYPDPKPAYTTLATFLKILKEKGFVQSESVGKMLRYSAVVKREEYTRSFMKDVKNTFFGGSLLSFVSFFAKEENLGQEEIDQIIDIIQKGKH